MDTIGLAFIIIAIVGMLVNGFSCMLSDRRPLSIGVLNFMLALVTAALALQLRTGDLVLAPEFGAVMVQGAAGVLILRLSLVAAATLPVLCWYRIRQLNNWPTRVWARFVPGLLIGIWAATRLHTINPDDLEVLRVQMFDVWWPPLIIWITLCLSETLMALVKVESQITGFAFSAALTAPLARFALTHQELSDPWSRPIWKYTEWIALCLCAMSILAIYVFPRVRGLRWRAVAWFGAVVVFLAGSSLFHLTGNTFKMVLDLLPLVILALIFGLAQGVQAGNAFLADLRARMAANAPADGSHRAILKDFAIGRAAGPLISLGFLVIPLVLADLLSIGRFNRDLEIGILVLVWLGFSSRLAVGALHVPRLFVNGVLQLSVLGVPAVGRWSGAAFSRTRRFCSSTGAGITKFFSGSGWAVAVRGICGTIFVMMALIAFGEMLQIHRLVIEPLEWQGGDTDKDRIADRISRGVVNSLGEMRRDLVPVLLVSAAATPKSSSGAQVRSAVLDSDAMRAALAKNDDLKVGNFTIPMSVVTDPLQKIVRSLLGIHVVSGTIHSGPQDHTFIILINSDPGDTWRVPGKGAISTTVIASAPPSATPTADASASEVPDCGDAAKERDPLDQISDEVAFRVANSDPFFQSMGLTTSWPAYVSFREGLRRWNCYQVDSKSSSLDNAIDAFRAATRRDPTFAPASYRLGLALESAGDLDAAIGAFQQTLASNRSFVQAEVAQAVALEAWSQPPPNVAAFAELYPRPDRTAEARAIWADLLDRQALRRDQLDRSSAYYHLCADSLTLDTPDNGMVNKFYLNYYYCSRAHALYMQMPLESRAADEQNQIEAYTLESLGDVLNYHDYRVITLSPKKSPLPDHDASAEEPWGCASGYYWFDESSNTWSVNIPGSSLTGHALRYYREGLALNPGDLQAMCNEAAATTFLRGTESKTMKRLDGRTDAHMSLASQFATYAIRYRWRTWEVPYFQKAVQEYGTAIARSPANADALNGYAYTVWRWALDSSFSPKMPRPTYVLSVAEHNAREAVRLAGMQQEHSKLTNNEDTLNLMNNQDTLGEILIAEGRDEEAVENLEVVAAAKDANVGGIDEETWDLAQALVCSSLRAGPQQKTHDLQEAIQQFTAIRDNEMQRELRPLTYTPGALNLQAAENRCFSPPEHYLQTPPASWKLKNVSFEPQPVCAGVVSVRGELEGPYSPNTVFSIEVVGQGDSIYAGTSQRIDLDAPSHSPRRYFVRALNDNYAASAYSPITLPDEHDCAHGQIVLHFAALNPIAPVTPLPSTGH